MAGFDTHIRCARCREKGTGSDPCVQGKDDCAACLLLTPEQRKQLAMPTYKPRKEKKSSGKTDVLVDPSQVSVVGPVDVNQSVASVASTPSNVSVDDSSVKKELSELKDEWSTRFANIEALLTMGSNPLSAQPVSAVGNIAPVFSPEKMKVAHPPPTGTLSSYLPHSASPPHPHPHPHPTPPGRFGSGPGRGISFGYGGTSGHTTGNFWLPAKHRPPGNPGFPTQSPGFCFTSGPVPGRGTDIWPTGLGTGLL